jgi:predicted metal-dependent peptidase
MDGKRYIVAKARDHMVRARTSLLTSSPFFGTLAMRLKLQEDWSEKTMAVDGVSIFYNPEFSLSLPLHHLKTVLAHGCLHVLLGHHERRGGRDISTWNDAADYAINPILDRDQNFSLPEEALLSKHFYDMPAEEIYAKLVKDSFGGGKEKKSGGKGKAEGGTSGGGKGSNSREKPNPMGEVRDKPKDAPSSASQDAWKGSASNLVKKLANGGSVPAHVEALVDGLVNPTVSWEEMLRQYMTKISRDDFSWRRPDRRFVSGGLYLPSAYSEQVGDVVIAIDVSGSINKPLLETFLSEVQNILEEVAFDSVIVLQCNTVITSVNQYFPGEDIDPKVVGRGGTRFQPVFDWVEEYNITPDVLLYFTDLRLLKRFAPKDPGYPVVWAKVPAPAGWVPTFGEIIQLEEKNQ